VRAATVAPQILTTAHSPPSLQPTAAQAGCRFLHAGLWPAEGAAAGGLLRAAQAAAGPASAARCFTAGSLAARARTLEPRDAKPATYSWQQARALRAGGRLARLLTPIPSHRSQGRQAGALAAAAPRPSLPPRIC
jgi:hypothetical protein